MKKRKIKGKILSLFCAIILLLLSIYKIPNFINHNRLLDLGYSEENIQVINKKGLRSTILKNNYYSDYLKQELMKDSFKKEYIKLYTVTDNLNEDSFYLYERLIKLKGYTNEELIELYGGCTYEQLIPLVVFDKVDINQYLEDISKHPNNNKQITILDNNYFNEDNIIEIEDKENIETFTSPIYTLNNYAPIKLVDIPSMNAIPGLQLESRGLDAFTQLCNALRDNDSPIYAVSAYKSYDNQNETYENTHNVQNQYVLKAGHHDSQLGLSVAIVSGENESVANYHLTRAYNFMNEHAHEYGFILRYPENKEAITGEIGKNNYYRYVGIDLANKIYESGLTFDEYYMLYLYEVPTNK